MKTKLLFAALLLGAVTANAQILNGTFEDDAMTGWRLIDADGDASNWVTEDINTGHFAFEGKYAISYSWTDSASYTPDNYLISPNVSIPENGAVLTFKKGYGFYSDEFEEAPDQLSVYIVPEGINDENIGQLTPIYDELFDTPIEQPSLTNVTVNLNAYAGQNVSVAFRHRNSNSQEYVYIDTVVITENTAGRSEAFASDFKLYPNPVHDVINIAANNTLINSVVLTDINGCTIKSLNYAGVNTANIDMSNIMPGMYIITVTSDKGASARKIIKS